MFRRLQFSLKTLLLLPLGVAIFFGGMATQQWFLERERERLYALIADAELARAEQIDLTEKCRLEYDRRLAADKKRLRPPLDSGLRQEDRDGTRDRALR